MLEKLLNIFKSNDARTSMVKRNIAGNIIVKGISIVLSLIIVPLTLGYVSEYNYGIWISLSSVIGWLTYFDIGINNGLRNKLTYALSQNNITLGRKLVSTTYAILIIIFGSILAIFLASFKWIDWYSFFSLQRGEVQYLSLIVIVIIGFICLRSVLNTVLIILFAYQRSAMSAFIGMLEQFAIVVAIFVLVHLTEGNLLNLCLVYCIAPLVILVIANLVMFYGTYRDIRPGIRYIDWKLKSQLFNLGLRFFIIQIAGLIQFQTVNYIILKFYGPVDVTAYNISFKYFNVLYMVWALLMAPIWSAVAEAKSKKELHWIAVTAKKYQIAFLMFFIAGGIMLALSPLVYRLWLGGRIAPIPFILSLMVWLYCMTLMFGSLYVQILNGLGALRIQFIASIISPIVFLATCALLIKGLHLGVASIVAASIIANFNGYILAPYQYHLIIRNKKPSSVWTKLD